MRTSNVQEICDPVASSPIAVGPTGRWGTLGLEMLDHLRLSYRALRELSAEALTGHPIAILLEPTTMSPGAAEALGDWVRRGGTLLCCGGAGLVGWLIGVTDAAAVTDEHVTIDTAAEWSSRFDTPLHAFGGRRLLAPDAATTTRSGDRATQVLAHWEDGAPAVVRGHLGAGRIVVIGADVWQSIGRIQQGWPIAGPGSPASDGSADVGGDGILRCDDGLALSFVTDRAMPDGGRPAGSHPAQYPPRGPVPVFHRPQADLWREVVLQLLLDAAGAAGVPLAMLHYWPAGIPAVGHISQDSDLNNDAQARRALEVFAAADIHVTWCHCWPGGYSTDVILAIGSAGHEHALHYNAVEELDGAPWGVRTLADQHRWATELTAAPIVSNKNHYTRWQGWVEFYDWCEQVGIEIDESRGPSRPGTAGFPYGTCHVGFPVRPDGERVNVLALPLHTQDVGWQTVEPTAELIVDQACRQHGVAHFLFHGAHLLRHPRTAAAVGAVIAAGRRRGMPWLTAGQINRFERARRGVRLDVTTGTDRRGGATVRMSAQQPVAAAGVVLTGLAGTGWRAVQADGTELPITTVERHGRELLEVTVDLDPGITDLLLSRAGTS